MIEGSPARGIVYLVGAGSGDPGVMTLRGQECLRRADVVLYDYLVNPLVLRDAAKAEKICLGRHGRDRIVPQDEINRQMVDLARAGKTVVRLKGGDPTVFAHLGEELAALAAAGLDYEVVPGITAALAVGSHAGIVLTHRDTASAVALVTGRERPDKETSAIDYGALANFPGTLVFYMGVTTAPIWTRSLIEGGKSPETPAVIIRRCSWPDQQAHACTLGTVATTIAEFKLRPPVVVVVGEVVAQGPVFDWFSRRELFGQRVLVTRPEHQAGALIDRLIELGADVIFQPAIEILAAFNSGPLDDAIGDLSKFDWVVFSSANGVRFFMDRLLQLGRDTRALASARLAAIGPGTADELRQYSLAADLMPADFRAEALADALSPDAAGKRFLLVRASRGREVLADQLSAAGAEVIQVVAYESRDVASPTAEVTESLESGQIDWITVTSSAIARSLVQMFGASLKKAKLASISPVTTATLNELGIAPAAEATEYTMPGLVRAIQTATRR